MPNSSAATAKTKSVWLSGRMRLTVPSPGPRPNQPPRWKVSSARSMLKVSPEPGSHEALDALRHVRHGEIRRRPGPTPAAPARPSTQTSRMPARKNSAPQTSATSMVWPKSGCSTSTVTTTSSSASAMVLAGISGRRADSPNSQAIRITKAGLRNSEGWMLIAEQHDPAPRALDLGAEERRRGDQQKADHEHDERERGGSGAATGTRSPAAPRAPGPETACAG